MARNPQLEAYLEARWNLDNCEPSQKPAARTTLENITAAILEGRSGLSQTELAAVTADAYREFCRARRLEIMKKLSRLR